MTSPMYFEVGPDVQLAVWDHLRSCLADAIRERADNHLGTPVFRQAYVRLVDPVVDYLWGELHRQGADQQ